MRVRLRGWFRSIALVPWHEAGTSREGERATLDAAELRRLIADVPGAAISLRSLLAELGDFLAVEDAELAERIAAQIERGWLRVEAEPYVPMSSESVVIAAVSRREAAPLAEQDDDSHWIEVELVDESGAPVVGERCRIALPDGTERFEKTNRDGLIRVDRTVAGQCTISFPDLDAGAIAPLSSLARQGTQVAPSESFAPRENHWVEVELVDERGVGVANELCEIELPTGELIKRRTNREGLVRVPRIATAGDCKIRFPELDAGAVAPLSTVSREGTQSSSSAMLGKPAKTHWVEVELVDESGAGVPGQLCEITLPDGERIRRRTDAHGLIRIPRIADPGDCQISFVELDAAVWADEPPKLLAGRSATG
jgi:hypothetical protein